jgi:hypothetical protein
MLCLILYVIIAQRVAVELVEQALEAHVMSENDTQNMITGTLPLRDLQI